WRARKSDADRSARQSESNKFFLDPLRTFRYQALAGSECRKRFSTEQTAKKNNFRLNPGNHWKQQNPAKKRADSEPQNGFEQRARTTLHRRYRQQRYPGLECDDRN